jgi:hypothetical protein
MCLFGPLCCLIPPCGGDVRGSVCQYPDVRPFEIGRRRCDSHDFRELSRNLGADVGWRARSNLQRETSGVSDVNFLFFPPLDIEEAKDERDANDVIDSSSSDFARARDPLPIGEI